MAVGRMEAVQPRCVPEQKLRIALPFSSLCLSLIRNFNPMESPQLAEAGRGLKVVFLPFASISDIIPVVESARVFAMFGVDVTIITTPANATIFQKSIDRDSARGRPISTHIVKFPFAQVGLPEGVETINADTSSEMIYQIYQGMNHLRDQFEQLFEDLQADCVVTDMFFPWSVESAAKLNIPRLNFNVSSCLAQVVEQVIEKHQPHTKVESDSDSFTIPGLPDEIKMTPLELQDWLRTRNIFTFVMDKIKDSVRKSSGSLFNSFTALEGAYIEEYGKIMGIKSWGVGPVALWANQDEDKIDRGHAGGKEDDGWLKWLNTKTEDSVIYVCFGSVTKFPFPQLVEIAHGLESSGHDFIWVIPKMKEGEEGVDFLEEFEKKVREIGKGYLIRGWAPQLLILEHPAIGGVVTQCGWNTIMESVNAGLPMVTWPLFAEQFENEKLLTDVQKIGVPVGAKIWRDWKEFGDEVMTREEIRRAVDSLMGSGEEAKERRRKAKELSKEARKAIQVGGSSHNNVMEIIEEIRSFKKSHKMEAKP